MQLMTKALMDRILALEGRVRTLEERLAQPADTLSKDKSLCVQDGGKLLSESWPNDERPTLRSYEKHDHYQNVLTNLLAGNWLAIIAVIW